VAEQPDKTPSVAIDEVNADLRRSLKLCHSVVDEFRLKLAANSNDARPANDEENDTAPLG